MKKMLLLPSFFLLANISSTSGQTTANPDGTHTYYISTDGNDANTGSIGTPFATLMHAQSLVVPGDTVFIRGGTYRIAAGVVPATTDNSGLYADINYFAAKTGASASKKIYYWGYKNERPVFDFSDVKPAGQRVTAFYVTGSYYYFKNFDVTHVQVTITDHTQSECFRNAGGNHNTYEYLAMHDGQAIGFYLTQGIGNLVYNCDAYNNYDSTSEGGAGGNTDGFGCHPSSTGGTGNVFRGCRAWLNSDDGFDLINAFAAVTFDSCWSFYNGYSGAAGSLVSRGDGNGFKAGGYGIGTISKYPAPFPQHTVERCLAYYNKQNGFYANHHLTGNYFYNNTAYRNSNNYNMVDRQSVANAVDVPGYRHTLKNNVSYSPRSSGGDIINVDLASDSASTSVYNSFSIPLTPDAGDFNSLDASQLTASRKADGSLPDITFMTLKSAKFVDVGTDVGLSYSGSAPDLGYAETTATLPVHYSRELNARFINGYATLDWATAEEINNKEFAIQKNSDSASGWQTLGFVKSHFENGNGDGYDYRYTDGTSLNGLTFYRLQQTGMDGKYAYSRIVSVQPPVSRANMQITLYPNPVTAAGSGVTLHLNTALNEPGTVHLYNVAGQLMCTYNIKQSSNLYKLAIPSLNSGLYILRVYAGNINIGSSKLLVK